MTEQTLEIGRLEWDFPHLNKRDWGEGEWLNEPDKLQCFKEGLPCLLLRGPVGAWCAYVGVRPGHPAYGLSYEGISQLVQDIIHAQFKENLRKWDRQREQFPDPTGIEPPCPSPIGEAVVDIRVHGGLTLSGPPERINPSSWEHIKAEFPKAQSIARRYPKGDCARWLKKWQPAFSSYEAFEHICMQTCRCFYPPDEEVWLFGFDCSHAFDLMPAAEARMPLHLRRSANSIFRSKEDLPDTYRSLSYVEAECLALATQLLSIQVKKEGTHE